MTAFASYADRVVRVVGDPSMLESCFDASSWLRRGDIRLALLDFALRPTSDVGLAEVLADVGRATHVSSWRDAEEELFFGGSRWPVFPLGLPSGGSLFVVFSQFDDQSCAVTLDLTSSLIHR